MYSPDAGLDAIRSASVARAIGDGCYREALDKLINDVEQLDNWITGGGPLPREWTRIRDLLGGARAKEYRAREHSPSPGRAPIVVRGLVGPAADIRRIYPPARYVIEEIVAIPLVE